MQSSQIIYGIHPVEEALKEGMELEKVFVLKDVQSTPLKKIFNTCRERGIPVSHVPVQKLTRLCARNHQGVVALLPLIGYHDFTEIINSVTGRNEIPRLLVLDHITDVRNFGALARTAHVFGYHGVVIPDRGSASINEDAMKTSAGALSAIKVCKSANLIQDCETMQEMGLKILACTEKSKVPMNEITVAKDPFALVLGSEEKGIHPAIIKSSDADFFIPMHANLGSLNVSVAGGIAMYHLLSDEANTQQA